MPQKKQKLQMETSKIENLSFCGGGVRIISEIGACEILESKGIIKQAKRVAGTSAGAIVSTMIALGYTASEMKEIAFSLNFNDFEDGRLLEKLNVLDDYGIHTGNTFLHFIQSKIEAKTGSRYTTFAGMYAKGMKDLTVFACNLNTKSLKIFNYEKTPNVSIADAVRCSMSIPLFFEVHQIDQNIYVDGGVFYNYPLTYFPEETTIGVCFNSYESEPDNKLKKGQFKKYIQSLMSCLGNSQSINLKENESQLKRSIVIDSLGISAVDFDITLPQKTAMYASGLKAASEFFA